MENKIDITSLSIHEVLNKIKAFKNNDIPLELFLLVRRHPSKATQLKKQVNSHKKEEFIPEKDDESVCFLPNIQYELENKKMKQSIKLYNKGYYEEAIKILQELYERQEIDEFQFPQQKERKMANLTFYLGNCHFRLENYEKAIKFYQNSFQFQNLKQKGSRKCNLGSCYALYKNHQLSLKFYNEALQIYYKFEEIDKSNLYCNVGLIYLKEKMYENAIQSFEKSIEERKLKSPENEAALSSTIFKLAISLKFEGLYEKSLSNLEKTLHYAERGIGKIVKIKKQIASVYEMMGQWRKALTCYEGLLSYENSAEINSGYIYERVGKICLNYYLTQEGQKNLKLALDFYRKQENKEKVAEIIAYFT